MYGFENTDNLELKNTGLIKVHENLSLIDPRLGADPTSVLGARISRSRNLNKRADSMFEGIDIDQLYWSHELAEPSEDVAEFLKSNLGGYGHASIADMALVSFYIHGIPLSVCWLLEDFALFKGMETSTRAVKYTPKTPQAAFCDNPSHVDFLTAYTLAGAKGTGYKFDTSRYLLPSSVPQGVVICGSARDIFTHIRNLRCFPWLDDLVNWCAQGLQLLAPKTWEQLAPKLEEPRPPVPLKWRPIQARPIKGTHVDISYSDIEALAKRLEHESLPVRPNMRTYMDSIFANVQVEIGFNISWVSARDFHRHRPGGDWLLSIPTEDNQWVFVGMTGDNLSSKDPQNELWNTLKRKLTLDWADLSRVPSGTLVRLERRMPLNYLVYMLELRAKTGGRNFEYADIAVDLMEGLVNAFTEMRLQCKKYEPTISRFIAEIERTQRLTESLEDMKQLNQNQIATMQYFPKSKHDVCLRNYVSLLS